MVNTFLLLLGSGQVEDLSGNMANEGAEGQRTKKSVESVPPRNYRDEILVISQLDLSAQGLKKDNTNRHASLDGGISWNLTPRSKNYRTENCRERQN